MKQISVKIFSFCLLLSIMVKGQGDSLKKELNLPDSLSTEEFNTIINKQFSKLITGQTSYTVGSYASLDIVSPNVTFSPNYISKNGNIIAVKFSGSASEGWYEIFNNSSLNNKISAELQFHLIDRNVGKSITYDPYKKEKMTAEKDELRNNFLKDSLALEMMQEKTNLILEKPRIEKLKKNLEEKILLSSGAKKDSLLYELKSTTRKISVIEKKINSMDDDWKEDQFIELRNKYYAEENKIKTTNLEIFAFSLGWWTLGYKVEKENFKLFYPTAILSKQLRDTSFVSHEFRIQYSYYSWAARVKHTYFISCGLSYSYANNLSELSAKEITDVSEYGEGSIKRSTSKKYTAYVGDYLDGFNRIKIDADAFYFLFTDNQAAIHFFPYANFGEREKPLWNIGVGIVYSFADSKKKGAIVNAELYYKMRDILNTSNEKYDLIERNSIGLRFSFPIDFDIN